MVLAESTADGSSNESCDKEEFNDEVDTQCGYTASCKPSFLQRCANPKVYLVVITLYGVMQGRIEYTVGCYCYHTVCFTHYTMCIATLCLFKLARAVLQAVIELCCLQRHSCTACNYRAALPAITKAVLPAVTDLYAKSFDKFLIFVESPCYELRVSEEVA